MATHAYAVGTDVNGNHRCPAYASGHVPSDGGPVCAIAEMYDEVAQDEYDIDEGVLPVDMAEEVWCEALRRFEQKLIMAKEHDNWDEAAWCEYAIQVGEEIHESVFN